MKFFELQALMPEDFARYCGENILVFKSVEVLPKRVRDLNAVVSQVRIL